MSVPVLRRRQLATQAKEISRVLKRGIPEGENIDFSLLEQVHVMLYGRYVLNPEDIR